VLRVPLSPKTQWFRYACLPSVQAGKLLNPAPKLSKVFVAIPLYRRKQNETRERKSVNLTFLKNVKPSNTFAINRSRLQLDADLTNSLSTMFEISANTEEVKAEDLYLMYKIAPKFSLKAGQLKKPFSYAQLKAARKLAIINRPICVEEYFNRYLGRDIGLIARVEPHRLVELEIGVFNGTGVSRNDLIDDNNAKDFVGRLEVKPTKWLEMAFNAAS